MRIIKTPKKGLNTNSPFNRLRMNLKPHPIGDPDTMTSNFSQHTHTHDTKLMRMELGKS